MWVGDSSSYAMWKMAIAKPRHGHAVPPIVNKLECVAYQFFADMTTVPTLKRCHPVLAVTRNLVQLPNLNLK